MASSRDDAAIRTLLRTNPMQGAIQLTFEREPDYYAGTDLAGGRDRTIVAYENDALRCMGRCSYRETWVNGCAVQTGYLAELRLDHSARGNATVIRSGYRYFEKTRTPAAIHFTSIASDNQRARRLLEAGARGLPTYQFLAELTTILVRVPRRATSRISTKAATAADLPAIVGLLNEQGRARQFATVWTEEKLLALADRGLPVRNLRIFKQEGRVIAVGGIWDQRPFRQVVIRGYSKALGMVRPLVNAVAPLLGKGPLPAVGEALRQAFVCPLALSSAAPFGVGEFLEALLISARELSVDYLSLALPANDPELASIDRRFAVRKWQSGIYAVYWPEDPSPHFEENLPFLPDIALL